MPEPTPKAIPESILIRFLVTKEEDAIFETIREQINAGGGQHVDKSDVYKSMAFRGLQNYRQWVAYQLDVQKKVTEFKEWEKKNPKISKITKFLKVGKYGKKSM